jgi:hypothetical protein
MAARKEEASTAVFLLESQLFWMIIRLFLEFARFTQTSRDFTRILVWGIGIGNWDGRKVLRVPRQSHGLNLVRLIRGEHVNSLLVQVFSEVSGRWKATLLLSIGE